MKHQPVLQGESIRCGRSAFRVAAATAALFLASSMTPTAVAQQAAAPGRPAASAGQSRVAQPSGPGAGGVAAVLPTTSLTATQCAQQGGSCDASGSCVKFVLNPDGGFRPVVLGTCGSGSGGDGPTPGGGGNPGPAFENHCVNGINDVDYGGIAFNCGAEGDRCRAACRNGSSATIRKKCNDACFQVNLNCCTGKDPIRAQCNGTIDPTRRSRCNADRVARDNRCGTDPGTFPGSTVPRSIQDCLQASRLREGDCCSGLIEPEG